MTMQHELPPRLGYQPPTLSRYGSMAAVTLAGSGTTAEGMALYGPGYAGCMYDPLNLPGGMMRHPCG